MENKICIHCFVSGKVQGVWYRASAQNEAVVLGVTGWARNLPDGRVEIIACGEKEQLKQLQAWLKKGPDHPQARVDDVTVEEVPWQAFDRFSVR